MIGEEEGHGGGEYGTIEGRGGEDEIPGLIRIDAD